MADSSNAGSDNEDHKKETVGTTIAEDLVVTKYKMASEITNRNRIIFFFKIIKPIK